MFLLFVLLPIVSSVVSPAAKPCIDLAACATKHCLHKKLIMKRIENATTVDSFEKIVTSFDMMCITTKCTTQCSLCESCHYAIEQIHAFVSGSSSKAGMCPSLEGCINDCVKGEDIKKIMKCVNVNCNIHCYDGECDPCKTMSKKIFTRFCREMHLVKLPQFANFEGSCPALFDKLSNEFVIAKKKH